MAAIEKSHPGLYHSPRTLVLSGKLTIPELFEWHAKENPDLPFFRFFDGHRLNSITSVQVIQAIRRVARSLRSRVGTSSKVIAVIANTDTITYTMTAMGILRAGHTMFLVSPRNVPAAIVDMMRKTDCKHILVSQDSVVQDLVRAASQDIEGVELYPMPTFEDIFPPDGSLAAEHDSDISDLPHSYDPEAIAMILHSSGSTNHPKPIRSTHKRMVKWSTAPWYGEVDLSMAVMSIHGTPMFHSVGVLMLFTAVNNGMVLATFPPSAPPIFPTPENVFEGVVKTSSEFAMSAPAFVESWSRDPSKVAYLKKMKALCFGGAPLSQEAGDHLASQGISIWTFYGSTEVGVIARLCPANPGMDWAYFKLSPIHDLLTRDVGDGQYELVILANPDSPLILTNTNIEGRAAYATNDLLVPHPTRPGMWRYHGRLDDQIVLSNGEKTNPRPLEDIINEDPHVHDCMMFGQGKFQNGVLIEPTPEFRLDPRDVNKVQEFRNNIWPTIERANAFAPTHSRIFKEMIMVTSPSKPFKYNIKNYPKRFVLLKEYSDEIEALYAEVEESAQSDLPAPTTWDTENTKSFLRTAVQKVVNRDLADDADFFRNGCDSLQATWIRNTILRAVREHSPAAARRVHMNIVFQAPTLSALTDAILQVIHDGTQTTTATTAEDLTRIAERYSAALPAHPSPRLTRVGDTGDVIVITGTTGGFGCDVLEHLLRDEKVKKVYAFNRPQSQAMQRQRARFHERGLQEALLDSPKFTMVEAALHVSGFGIAPDLLREITSSVTHIMHNAWTVNFNLTLPSFDADLRAVRHLIELSLSCPYEKLPTIQFVSSIGIFRNCTIPPPIPEVPIDPSAALGTGYAESKWAAERILFNVAEQAGVPFTVVRLGQVSGDKNGHWNEREWFPALVKSARFTQCLPDVKGSVSFITSYLAARAFMEMRNSSSPILHLVHPRPVEWHTLITPIAEELKVPLVTYATWLSELERIAAMNVAEERNTAAMVENPAIHLMDFFRSRTEEPGGKEALGIARLSTVNACNVSETLAHVAQLSEEDTKRWMMAWRASGFM